MSDVAERVKKIIVEHLGVEEAKQTILRSAASSHQYNLILIDFSLPDKNAFELIHWINGLKKVKLTIILMLTYPDLQLKIDYPALGVTAVLMKPIRPSELLKTFSTHAPVIFALTRTAT